MNYYSYLIFSISLIVWCIIHSLLISNKISSRIKTKLDLNYRFYRICYNLFSLLTFIPLVAYAELNKGEYIFIWSGYFLTIRGVFLLISLILFIAGAKQYDGLFFLGIRQIIYPSNQNSLTESGRLEVSGILNVIRHPWYSATLLLLWSRNIDINILIVNVILTSYLIIGSYLEEKKLIAEYGDKYRLYQQNVSMLFPYKWLKSKIIS